MTIDFSKTALKHIAKLSTSVRNQLTKRLHLFIDDPDSPQLHRHKLKGEYNGYVSINISGDYRLVYKELSPNHVYVVAIGTHSQLYS